QSPEVLLRLQHERRRTGRVPGACTAPRRLRRRRLLPQRPLHPHGKESCPGGQGSAGELQRVHGGIVSGKVVRVETREYRWCWTAAPLETRKFLTDECFDYSASILWRGGKWLILTDGHGTIAENFEGYVLTDGS